MPNVDASTIALSDIIEATSNGVLRALEARKIGQQFTDKNGFFVKIDITAGGYPLPILRDGQIGLPRAAVETGG